MATSFGKWKVAYDPVGGLPACLPDRLPACAAACPPATRWHSSAPHGRPLTGPSCLYAQQVTGMAVDNVTSGYDFPAQGTNDVGGGLVDVSTPAAGHSTEASPEMQRQVQEFFERRQHQQRQQPAPAAPPALAEAGEAGGSQEVEGEGGGGSAEERPDQVQPPVL